MLRFIILFLTSYSLLANECTTYKKVGARFNTEMMFSGSRFSYFDRGESLANFKTQDQDGIGSCYANSLSAALKVAHKDHPDISYLHASMMGSIYSYHGRRRKLFDSTKDEIFNEGNWVCYAFERIKEHGGACAIGASGLENNSHQKSILKSLATFLDFYHLRTTDKADLSQKMKKLFENVSAIKEKMKKECMDQKELGFAPIEIVDQYLRNFLFAERGSRCGTTLKAAVRQLYDKSTVLWPDSITGEFRPEFIQKMRGLFSSSQSISSLRKFNKMYEDHSFEGSNKIINPILEKLEKLIKAKVTDSSCMKENIFPPTSRHQLFKEIYLQNLKSEHSNCEQFEDRNIFEKLTHSEAEQVFSCIPSEIQPTSENMISHLTEFNNFFGDQLIDKLLEPNGMNSFDQLLGLVMPRCRQNVNLISLDSTECEEKEFKDLDSGLKFKSFQETILSGLKDKKGIAITVCSDFMDSSTFTRTNFCETNVNPNVENSYHAMSVTGYRCMNGKIQYQILNSWGSNCPSGANENFRNDFMECELNAQGIPTGKFWVDEEVLLDSTVSVSVISG